jgi:hypothetical protein
MESPTRSWLAVSALVVVLVASGVVLGTGRAAAQEPPAMELTYSIETRGPVTSDVGHFSRVVAASLNDPRGWSLGGSIFYREVGTGGDFRVVLATPEEVAAAAPVCSAEWSCQVGDDALINEMRFTTGAPGFPKGLPDYQSYVVNHEVGHWLGFGHPPCGGFGQPGPVMMQQSISIEECEANTWPLPWEQEEVAAWYQVELRRSEVLSPTTTGAGVADWQQNLNETGAALAVDGIFGPLTEGATRNFQAFFGLPADGVADPETRGVMRYLLSLEPRNLGMGARGEDVAQWQRGLNSVTGAGLAVDGIYGPATRGSTQGFQNFFGVEPHGDVRQIERDLMAYLRSLHGYEE